jgi:hypothetical protein
MRIRPMMAAQTGFEVPKTLPSRRAAPNSAARLVIPEINTVKYRYFRMGAL